MFTSTASGLATGSNAPASSVLATLLRVLLLCRCSRRKRTLRFLALVLPRDTAAES